MKRSILRWELLGIAFVFFLGALLHFVFELSGESKIVGLFGSVNESVWEHFKLGYWPMLLYAAIEYPLLRKDTHNFLVAKTAGVYIIPFLIAVIFYSYTFFIGREILIADILIFAVAVTVGQLTSYRILTLPTMPRWSGKLALVFLILLALALMLFTFYPPHLPIFQDFNTGNYGIPK